jgi:hypothetical protein
MATAVLKVVRKLEQQFKNKKKLQLGGSFFTKKFVFMDKPLAYRGGLKTELI